MQEGRKRVESKSLAQPYSGRKVTLPLTPLPIPESCFWGLVTLPAVLLPGFLPEGNSAK